MKNTYFDKSSKFWKFLAASMIMVSASASAAPLLVTEKNSSGADILIGAKNVGVGGSLYDVSFNGGSCNTVFDGCKSSLFMFSTQAEATSAATALLDQVLVGIYDSDPLLVKGCLTLNNFCGVLTPYSTVGSTVNLVTARNFPDTIADQLYTAGSTVFSDNTSYRTWAVWSKASITDPAKVPEPASVLLFGVAFTGMALARRSRQKRQ